MTQFEKLQAALPGIMKARDMVFDLIDYADNMNSDKSDKFCHHVSDAYWAICHIESSIINEIDRSQIEAYMEKHGCTESMAKIFYRGERLSEMKG